MRAAPDIDKDALARAIQAAYALPVETLEYLPVGMVGHHYLAQTPGGERLFLTLYDDSYLSQNSIRRLHFTLPATYLLQQSALFTELAAPLPAANGALYIKINGWPLVLYPYIEGHVLLDEEPYSQATQVELGCLAARLHAATPAITLENPIQDDFTIPFAAALQHSLNMLEVVKPGELWERAALRKLLLPHQSRIFGLLERLHALAELLRQTPPPMVICHTDMHGANILRTPQGRLVVVDWEGVCLAPAEYDLFIFTGPGFETFLQAYYAAGGGRKLSASTFAFYFYRRNLEDLTDFIVRILNEEADSARDLTFIQPDIIDGWSNLETAIPRMQTILDGMLSTL